jgi:hypothetical protein
MIYAGDDDVMPVMGYSPGVFFERLARDEGAARDD